MLLHLLHIVPRSKGVLSSLGGNNKYSTGSSHLTSLHWTNISDKISGGSRRIGAISAVWFWVYVRRAERLRCRSSTLSIKRAISLSTCEMRAWAVDIVSRTIEIWDADSMRLVSSSLGMGVVGTSMFLAICPQFSHKNDDIIVYATLADIVRLSKPIHKPEQLTSERQIRQSACVLQPRLFNV